MAYSGTPWRVVAHVQGSLKDVHTEGSSRGHPPGDFMCGHGRAWDHTADVASHSREGASCRMPKLGTCGPGKPGWGRGSGGAGRGTGTTGG